LKVIEGLSRRRLFFARPPVSIRSRHEAMRLAPGARKLAAVYVDNRQRRRSVGDPPAKAGGRLPE
jgi:hypothetical protein